MAQFDVRRSDSTSRIDALLLKLENPQRFLQEEAGLLVGELQSTAPVEKGTLKSGLNYVRLYQNGSWSWGIGIGNPDILTSWRRKPPPGTIGDFVDWLRAQNEGYLGENQTRVGYRTGLRTYQQAAGAERRNKSVKAREVFREERLAESSRRSHEFAQSKAGKAYYAKAKAKRVASEKLAARSKAKKEKAIKGFERSVESYVTTMSKSSHQRLVRSYKNLVANKFNRTLEQRQGLEKIIAGSLKRNYVPAQARVKFREIGDYQKNITWKTINIDNPHSTDVKRQIYNVFKPKTQRRKK